MATICFDTLAFFKRLRGGGYSEGEAEGIASVLCEMPEAIPSYPFDTQNFYHRVSAVLTAEKAGALTEAIAQAAAEKISRIHH